MKSKKSRILGVALTLALLASLFGFAAPVAAAPGNTQWLAQDVPDATYNVLVAGSNVVEYAVGPDGTTIYAINNAVAAGTVLAMNAGVVGNNFHVYKSTDGGQSWTGIDMSTKIVGAPAFPLANVAVAPDDPNVVAVSSLGTVGTAADFAFVSKDGGITWTQLPALVGAAASMRIIDLKVGPARAGTWAGREYLVATADDTATLFALGSLQIVGAAAAWTLVSAAGLADFMACEFSPGYVGDRIVVGVGSDNVTGTNVYTYETQTPALLSTVPINAAVIDYALPAAADTILAADIALPVDYDRIPGYERLWASYATNAPTAPADAGGVHRVDDGLQEWELGLAGVAIQSIAYSGDIDSGTLFAGYRATTLLTTTVRYTTSPTINNPVWSFSRKAPTGNGGLAYVRLAPNFATSETVYCGTSSAALGESAFSVSTDAGFSFNQESLIDSEAANDWGTINGMALTPDGNTLFVATDDAAQLSLWQSATPVTPTSWSRIFCFTGLTGVLTINYAEWATNPEIYFAETPMLANQFYVSVNGGASFAPRTGPVLAAAINGISAESSRVVYVASVNDVYKSTVGGPPWGAAVPANANAIVSVAAAGDGHVLVGGTGGLTSLSTDGGASFVALPAGLPANTFTCIPDENYATNSIAYAGDTTAAGLVYRINVDTGTVWENLVNPTAANLIVGMAMGNGALYAMTDVIGASRTLTPHDPAGTLTWRTLDSPPAGTWAPALAITSFDMAGNKLYAADGVTPALWAYDDWLATATPVVTFPYDGYALPIDPNLGTAQLLQVNLASMGSGTGLVNRYNVAIWDKAAGSGAMTILINAADLPVPTTPSFNIAAVAAAPNLAFTMQPNTEYEMMFRAANQVSGDAVVSPWTDVITISVQAGGVVVTPQVGPVLQGPLPGATDVSLNPGFSWTPISGATLYEFILATNSTLTDTVEGTPVYVTQPSWQVPELPGTLEYGTTYFWGVKATEPTESPQSIGTFQTMSIDVYTCPICGDTFTTAGALDSHIAAVHPAATPAYIWAIIAIGAVLMIAVIMLIMKTRRVT